MKVLQLFVVVLGLLMAIPGARSQGIEIGQWREHLPYTQGKAVGQLGQRVFCATQHALFSYDLDEALVERYSKTTGLSDIGLSAISASPDNDLLIIAYSNTNIDLFYSNNQLLNIPDIKRKSILGKKTINRIHCMGTHAYLACGFGIVVLDLERGEISDTYYIGENGDQIEVFDITHDDSMLYAGTENGLMMIRLDEPNPADFAMWSVDTSFSDPGRPCTALNTYHGKLYCARDFGQTLPDSLFVREAGKWISFASITKAEILGIKTFRDQLMLISTGDVDMYDVSGQLMERIFSYTDGVPFPSDAIIGSDDHFWIADRNKGLVRSPNTWSSETFHPQGPISTNTHAMAVEGGNLWVVPGGHNFSWNNFYRTDGVSNFDGYNWNHFKGDGYDAIDTLYDLICVVADPSDPGHVFAGSWGFGLAEFRNGQVEEVYHPGNSSLESSPSFSFVGVAGMAYDESGNLWVTNSLQSKALSVYMADGTWQSFNLSPVISTQILGEFVIDNYGQKWILLPRSNGMIVFSDNGTPMVPGDDKKKLLTTGLGSGNLPSTNILCLALDKDGELWLGSDKGIAVIYAPGNAFNGGNFDAQQILVEYDGYIQNLLESETITSLAVDGANRKWVGTERAGVFLLSADGTSEIHHFTTENSPLLSDNIIDIVVDDESGEVYIATDKGIVSYRGSATEGGDYHSEVYAFPNPVRPGYSGVIAIRGLVDMADIKITDVNGRVVHATTANGGQAVWDGTDINGQRVHSGVYLVFSTNNDDSFGTSGDESFVTKILFIR